MVLKKYVEIEWEELRIDFATSHEVEPEFLINSSAQYPSSSNRPDSREKVLSGLVTRKIGKDRWSLRPNNSADSILFAGYVEDTLLLAISVFQQPPNQLQQELCRQLPSLENPVQARKLLLPFLGISDWAFSGVLNFLQKREEFVGMMLFPLKPHVTFPLKNALEKKLVLGNEEVGNIALRIFMRPDYHNSFFCSDVAIFPHSHREVMIHYGGDLCNTEQLFLIWTLDNWESNPLVKMKKYPQGQGWFSLIELPENLSSVTQLELSFTDAGGQWDNQDGSNWVFQNFQWS